MKNIYAIIIKSNKMSKVFVKLVSRPSAQKRQGYITRNGVKSNIDQPKAKYKVVSVVVIHCIYLHLNNKKNKKIT